MSVSRDLGEDFGAGITPGLLHETLPSSRNQRGMQGEPAHLRTSSTTWLCTTTAITHSLSKFLKNRRLISLRSFFVCAVV